MKFTKENGLTKMTVVIITTIVILIAIIISALITFLLKSDILNSTKSVSNNNQNDTSSDKVNSAEKEITGFYSILDHLPNFSNAQRDAASILWASGIPLNENPLTYKNGQYVRGLYYMHSGIYDEINLSVDEISNIHVNDTNAWLTEYSLEYNKNAQYCRLDISNGDNKFSYTPMCYDDNSNASEWNSEYYSSTDLTFGNIFENGLYSSTIYLDALGIDSNLSLEEKLNKLYSYFGNPSGLYWKNNTTVLTKNIQQYKTFEEFRDAPIDGEPKHYSLIWDYGSCFVVLELDDYKDYNETSIIDICLYQYVSDNSAFRGYEESDRIYRYIIDGHIGYGRVPGQIRSAGSNLE